MALLHDNTVSPRDDRRIRGKLLREVVPRESHCEWKAPKDRPDPVDMLEESNKGRIQHLIPIRYGRMLQTPFTFYRGAAALMARDLSYTPNSKVKVQACGDCHLMNFGAFATPERNVVFDINDFDETLPAPWEWDIKRLAASFVLACRDNGLKPKVEVNAAAAVVEGYREKMVSMSKLSIMDIWYEQVPWESVIANTGDLELQKRRADQLKKAKKRTIQLYYFPKLVETGGESYKIKDNPPLIFHPPEANEDSFYKSIEESLKNYRSTLQWDKQRLFDRYKLVDFAIKVVGIGSVGTTCGILLFLAPDDEPLLLQAKEARPSVLEAYVGKSTFENNGERVVAGQRIVQSASDIFLGWTQSQEGKDFYIRQLRDTKVKLEAQFWDAKEMVDIAKLMGQVLARAHARSGDAAVISGYLGNNDEFDKAIGQFAVAYADQTEKDFAALTAAVNSGRIKAAAIEPDKD
ncbi:MAG: DUF2252 domain-containing protein [Candidatus Melainabacteria bacterium]|nr:DUF2252 domain-containing protein [Candidatus Melainabacteria bacterium]